jgi:phosphoglycerol transferase
MYRIKSAQTAPKDLEKLIPAIDGVVRFDQRSQSSLVLHASGLSGPEQWGTWTIGKVARIDFVGPLPRHFILHIETAAALSTSVGVDLGARVGSVRHDFQVAAGPTEVSLRFDLDETADSIEFEIPNPRSPLELGINRDRRPLGIGLKEIRIEAREAGNG